MSGLAFSIPFWRYAEKCDAIGLLRDTITKLTALDLALAAVAVDAGVSEPLAGAADAAARSVAPSVARLDPGAARYELPASVGREVAR